MHTGELDIISLEPSLEATALRATLEAWGVKVNLYHIAQPKHLETLLGGQDERAEHILLSGHGNEQGFILPELHHSLNSQQPFIGALTPAHVLKYLRFTENTILSTCCMTGSDLMAKPILQKGAAHYLAPRGYPDGNAALYYALTFYYQLFCNQLPVRDSHERAAAVDAETNMFYLFTTNPTA